jgi:hypothetical protein
MSKDRSDESLSESARQAKFGVTRASDRRIQADLETALNDKIMAQSDAGTAIAREFDLNASLMLPVMTDMERPTRVADEPLYENLREIEQLLSLDKVVDIAKEGSRLNELLDRGGATIEERKILQRGMLFLRRRMYREADEWWLLNSPEDRSSHFFLLLQLLRAITCRLAGDEPRAVMILSQVKQRLGRK